MGCINTTPVWTNEDHAKYRQLLKMWKDLDIDGSGTIEVRELKTHLDKHNKGKKPDMQAVRVAFEILDVDGSGTISFEEFLRHNGLRMTPEVKSKLHEDLARKGDASSSHHNREHTSQHSPQKTKSEGHQRDRSHHTEASHGAKSEEASHKKRPSEDAQEASVREQDEARAGKGKENGDRNPEGPKSDAQEETATQNASEEDGLRQADAASNHVTAER